MSQRPLPRTAVVVGGGVTGLATARRLAQRGLDVQLVEAAPRVGGQVRTAELAGRPVDVGAEALHLGSPPIRAVIEELGLTPSLVHSRAGVSWLWTGQALRPLPAGVGPAGPTRLGPVLTSGVMSVRGLGRAGLEPLAARLHRPLPADADMSVGDFITDRFGTEVTERLLDPLLGSLHAGDVRRLSLRACAPGLVEAATRRRSVALRRRAAPRLGPPTALFASWPGGLTTLTDHLLDDVPVRVQTGRRVTAVTPTGAGYRVDLHGAAPIWADTVALAVPAASAAPLLAPHCPAASDLLRATQVAQVATVVMGFERATMAPLRAFAGNGILVSSRAGLLLKAVTNLTRKWPQFADDRLGWLRLSVGRAGCDRLAALDDDAVLGQVARDLATLTGLRVAPRLTHVHRWDDGLPQLSVGHQARLATLREALARALPGVVLAGSAYDGLGIGSCLVSAEAAVATIAGAATVARAPDGVDADHLANPTSRRTR